MLLNLHHFIVGRVVVLMLTFSLDLYLEILYAINIRVKAGINESIYLNEFVQFYLFRFHWDQ